MHERKATKSHFERFKDVTKWTHSLPVEVLDDGCGRTRTSVEDLRMRDSDTKGGCRHVNTYHCHLEKCKTQPMAVYWLTGFIFARQQLLLLAMNSFPAGLLELCKAR